MPARPLSDVAASLGLADSVVPFGPGLGKILGGCDGPPRGRLVLVSAITPTPAGEGKTTVSIGLADALAARGRSVCLALREPSLGPCMGLKGGGTGGGEAHLVPADRINLHCTGDFHAIGAAHNLIAAVIDNHLHFNGPIEVDPTRVLWPRVLDMNDRALRDIVVGLGGRPSGPARESAFDITAASELMAILCLAEDLEDLRRRIDRILIGFDKSGAPLTAGQLGVTGAVVALLRDAIAPNLVQTGHGTPALVHGGPFANIAHGCSSVAASRAALRGADWAVTEAGFGFDLGAEKFFDIKCRASGLDPAVVVLVASVRALKHHGGAPLGDLGTPSPEMVERGLANLSKHAENVAKFKAPPVVAVNRFDGDTDEEIQVVLDHAAGLGLSAAVCNAFAEGPAGAVELADAVVACGEKETAPFRPLYPLDASIPEKICTIAREMYGADDVSFMRSAERDLRDIERLGFAELPVCIAKTPSSLSDDPKLRGRPSGFTTTVRRMYVNAGAGFVVVLTGDVLRMPGLPRQPRAERIDLAGDGTITGLA